MQVLINVPDTLSQTVIQKYIKQLEIRLQKKARKAEKIPNADSALTEAQKTELDNRLHDYLTHPDDVLSWQEVKALALAKIAS